MKNMEMSESLKKFFEMLKRQILLDQYIHPKNMYFTKHSEMETFLIQNYFASFSELNEIMDCFFWKHWTKEAKEGKYFCLKSTQEELKFEVVDLLHFLLQLTYNIVFYFANYNEASDNFKEIKTFFEKLNKEKILELIKFENLELEYSMQQELFFNISFYNFWLYDYEKEANDKSVYSLLSMSENYVNLIKNFKKLKTKNEIEDIFSQIYKDLNQIWILFFKFCFMIDFDYEDLYQKYITKNKINIKRQNENYAQEKK